MASRNSRTNWARLVGTTLRAQRLRQGRARCGRDDFLRAPGQNLAARRDRLLPEAEGRREQGVGDADGRVSGSAEQSLAVQVVGPAQHSPRERLFPAPEGLAARPGNIRERVGLPPLQEPDGLLVLQPVRVLLERLLETLERPLQAVLLEVTEAELEYRLLRVGLELQRLLEMADRAGDLALLAQHGPQEHVRGGLRRDVQGLQQLGLRVRPARRMGVERPEREVRQEGVGGRRMACL